MNKFLNSSNNFTIFFSLVYLLFSNNSFYSQCNSPCFCLQVDEIGEVHIVWDTLNITNVNLFEHQFYAVKVQEPQFEGQYNKFYFLYSHQLFVADAAIPICSIFFIIVSNL